MILGKNNCYNIQVKKKGAVEIDF